MREYIRHNRQQWIVIEITYLSTTTTWIVGVIFKDIKCVHRNHLVGCCCVGKSFYIIYALGCYCLHTPTTNTKAIETGRMKVYKKRKGFPFWMGSHKTHTHFVYRVERIDYRVYGFSMSTLYYTSAFLLAVCCGNCCETQSRAYFFLKIKIYKSLLYLFVHRESHGHFENHIKILSWLCCCWTCLLSAVDGCLLLPIRPSRQTGTRLWNWQSYRR